MSAWNVAAPCALLAGTREACLTPTPVRTERFDAQQYHRNVFVCSARGKQVAKWDAAPNTAERVRNTRKRYFPSAATQQWCMLRSLPPLAPRLHGGAILRLSCAACICGGVCNVCGTILMSRS